jgi:anti-sigma factor RsiW
MTCRELHPRLAAYADDELGVEAAIEVEAHLERCPACRAACERQRAFGAAVWTLYPRRTASPELRASLHRRLGPRPWWRRVTPYAALAASIVLALGVWRASDGWLAQRSPDGGVPPMVASALRAHAGAEGGQASLAIASSNLAEVNRWLADAVPFAGPLPAAAPALHLEGASAVELDGDHGAWVLYRQGGEPVSLFILPQRRWPAMGEHVRHRDVEFRSLALGPHRVVAWNHDPVSYLLVSPAADVRGEACATCHLGSDLPPVAGFAAHGS